MSPKKRIIRGKVGNLVKAVKADTVLDPDSGIVLAADAMHLVVGGDFGVAIKAPKISDFLLNEALFSGLAGHSVADQVLGP